jgi:hypothetical protein
MSFVALVSTDSRVYNKSQFTPGPGNSSGEGKAVATYKESAGEDLSLEEEVMLTLSREQARTICLPPEWIEHFRRLLMQMKEGGVGVLPRWGVAFQVSGKKAEIVAEREPFRGSVDDILLTRILGHLGYQVGRKPHSAKRHAQEFFDTIEVHGSVFVEQSLVKLLASRPGEN